MITNFIRIWPGVSSHVSRLLCFVLNASKVVYFEFPALFCSTCHVAGICTIFIDRLHTRDVTSSVAAVETSHSSSSQRQGWGVGGLGKAWAKERSKREYPARRETRVKLPVKRRQKSPERSSPSVLVKSLLGSRNGGSELADHVSIELFRKIDIWHKNVVFQFETCKIYSISTCS